MTTTDNQIVPYQDEEEQQPLPTEIIPYTDPSVALAREMYLDESEIPLHEQYLAQQSSEVQESIADVIYGADSRPLSEYVGKELEVYGLFIYEQKPFLGKDQQFHPGYFQTRIITVDKDHKDEPFIVLHTSSKGVFLHAVHILKNRGWFLFERPVRYRLSVGKNNAQHLYNTEHDLKKRLQKPAK